MRNLVYLINVSERNAMRVREYDTFEAADLYLRLQEYEFEVKDKSVTYYTYVGNDPHVTCHAAEVIAVSQ